MITKNHTIELKDTSVSEMARFRQIMLGIWSQQKEDDKNTGEMLRYFENSHLNRTAHFVTLNHVIECIKKKVGNIYPNTSLSTFLGYEMSTPDTAGSINYTDSQGAQKQGGVSLEWNTFNGINLVRNTFRPAIDIGEHHTDFTLTIFDHNLKEVAFKFTVHDFDIFISLFDLLGIVITSDDQVIIDLYLKKIKEANNNPNKLDVIYESLPRTLFGRMNDEELYKHLYLILNDISFLEGTLTPTNFDTNEDKAVLHILYAIKDRALLYNTLRNTELLFKIYKKLHGAEIQDLLRFLTHLVTEFDSSKPKDTVYFDNSYYLFRDTHVKTDWSAGKITINNYKNETKLIGKARQARNPKELDKMYPPGVEEVHNTRYFIPNKAFNPLAKLNFGTKLGDVGEQVGDENTFVIALKLHNMATKQSNWDLFNVATDLLSLLSAYGALRVVLAKGAPIAARALAGTVLAKDATHYIMLSNGTLEKWHENGYSWLANLWIAFSVTVDLASFGLPNLSKIAKEGKAASELAETAEDAKEIKRVADEANRIVEAETGKDISKMSDKEYEDFFDYLANWEGNPQKTKVGLFGAKKLNRREIAEYKAKINVISEGKAKLVIVSDSHKSIKKGKQAGFNAYSSTIYVKRGFTEFEIFHEYKHLEECIKIGKYEYLKGAKDISGDLTLDLIRTYKREKYVFDEIMKNKTKFNEAQINDAKSYINNIIEDCTKQNIDVTKVK
ncbi:zincin-like metallopeptidase toxin domain-containing protein [Flavobacterium sp. T12S277]|uniref:zincin-like metallopeptidase toxin domain-containing protein n=1 Tax=Flavobacterium sp. T12S277 TaxID=3402752 RepID=UPI003AEE606A